jgi:acetyltransferase-like isoleucine patch superfamily enzyme
MSPIIGYTTMKTSEPATPEAVMRDVTIDIIRRAIKKGRKKGRSIYISKTSNGKKVNLEELNPDTLEGARKLDAYLTPVGRHYTFSGLGAPEEKNAINWRTLNLSPARKVTALIMVGISFLMKGTPLKNRLYRRMGMHIGKNAEIMQLVWLDHFRPELIFIGDHTLLGAYTHVTAHAYEGCGKFRYGLVEIGSNCVIGAGTGIGPMLIEDGVRTLPGTTLSPYLVRVRAGSVVGYNPPPVKLPESKTPVVETAGASN